MNIAVIGGGAAGFFAAISAKENYPDAEVTILEKSQKLLSKVKISGGGRCNVTNGCTSVGQLCQAYPRGGKKLKKIFHQFNTRHTIRWFESRGVPLFTQDDGRVFPQSQSSQSVIDCFLQEAKRLSITIELGKGVKNIRLANDRLALTFIDKKLPQVVYDKVIVATGGSPTKAGLAWLEALGHTVKEPVPSLFTFNMPSEEITQLMGLVVENTLVSIQGTKLKSEGPLLITHWGMSGPAVLKLSAFGARVLNDLKYDCKVQINWINQPNHETVIDQLRLIAQKHPKKQLANSRPFALPERLWHYLLKKREVPEHRTWADLGKTVLNQLVSTLTNDVYAVKGKTTFKEEFVTCGGVRLPEVDLNTMRSKVCPNLYFAGEVLDIDAITGGYNFQAAWTSGFLAGKLS